MTKNRPTFIWRALELGTAIGLIGLMGCDDGSTKDGSVFESDGSRVVQTESGVRTLPVPNSDRDILSAILRNGDAFARAERLGALLPTLGAGPVQELKAVLADPTLSIHIGGAEIELLTRYWATHDPESASTWAVEKSPPAYRTAAVFSTVPVWAKVDPFAAIEAIEGWQDRRDVNAILPVALVMGWYSAGDPPELQVYMEGLGISFPRQRALAAYVRAKLRGEGPDEVMRWAEAIPEDAAPRFKLAAYRQVGSGVALYDLEAALGWCDAHCEGPYGADLRGAVVRGWMQSDPDAALKWLMRAPEGQQSQYALRTAYAGWLRENPEAAMQWMTDQVHDGPPAALIPTYPVYARALGKSSPARAIPFAELITDEIDLEIVLVELATAWRAEDEAACETWLKQSPLSEQARNKVRGLEQSASEPG